jgi:hypothetical protein
MKLLIVQFSPTSRHFVSLRSKYSPQQDSAYDDVFYVGWTLNEKQAHEFSYVDIPGTRAVECWHLWLILLCGLMNGHRRFAGRFRLLIHGTVDGMCSHDSRILKYQRESQRAVVPQTSHCNAIGGQCSAMPHMLTPMCHSQETVFLWMLCRCLHVRGQLAPYSRYKQRR